MLFETKYFYFPQGRIDGSEVFNWMILDVPVSHGEDARPPKISSETGLWIQKFSRGVAPMKSSVKMHEAHNRAKDLHDRMTKEQFVVLKMWDETSSKFITMEDGTVMDSWSFSEIKGIFDSLKDAENSLKKETKRIEKATGDDGHKEWIVYTKDRPMSPTYLIVSSKLTNAE